MEHECFHPSLGLQGFTEFLGTFLLVAVILTKGRALAIGIMLIAIIYFGAKYSKTSYNPAASAALFGRGDIDSKELVVYIVAEVLGGIAALYWYNLQK
jgi:glycerol uptake facilitator-like aquaporin